MYITYILMENILQHCKNIVVHFEYIFKLTTVNWQFYILYKILLNFNITANNLQICILNKIFICQSQLSELF